jgi:16S rRNA (cytosine967-C5)-methyltransferase
VSPIPSQQARQRRLKRPTKVTRARWAAWQVLHRTFDEDAWTDRAFAGVVEQRGLNEDLRERAFAQQLAYGAVQHARQLDHVIATLGKRPLRKLDPPVLHALRIGTYELLHLQQATDEDGRRLGSSSAHAAVDQAVELVRGVVGERAVAFTNAILRRAQVDGQAILDGLDPADDEDLATQLSMPTWLVRRARAAHGDDGVAALAAQNTPHAAAFRDRASGEPLVVEGSTAHLAERIDRGELLPQSLASQQVVRILDPQPGERLLDMCAAPGGKATHAASLLRGEGALVAIELHPHRADSIRALARRVGVDEMVDVRVADATLLDPAEIGAFDRVLVDAPCTGTGVLAARPDARWKRTEEALDELVDLQRRLLAAAATLVKPGGTVVYSTCSILREEDEDVVAGRPATLELLDEHRTWPHRDDTDGFYVARMRRTDDDGGDDA